MTSAMKLGAITMIAAAILALAFTGRMATAQSPGSSAKIEYRNAQYGFCFTLPDSWKGYTIISKKWVGFPLDHGAGATGPELYIRHPAWTEDKPREDIPIMIFTTAEWQRVKGADAGMGVSAAPFPPSELGHNRDYVFALPPRFDFDQLPGVEEVGALVTGKSLRAPCGQAGGY
jgi:hypothetical protein